MTEHVYAAWVTQLRAWRDDPATDLSRLPALTVSSFPPDTYVRLLAHLNSAITHVNDIAWERFHRTWNHADQEHDRVRALVQLRTLLARRLQLCAHPGLPEEIRTALRTSAEQDIRRAQKELENASTHTSATAASDRFAGERLLYLLRTNRLDAILAPDFPLDALFVPAIPALQLPGHQIPPVAGPTLRRRIVCLDPDS